MVVKERVASAPRWRVTWSAAFWKQVENLRSEVGQRYSFDNVIGRSPGMQSVLDTVARVAPLKTTG